MPQELEVTSVTISSLLDKLRSREWMIPAFQRNFVWTIGDVSSLVYSILERRPIGMATLWQQPDESALPLEAVSIPDRSRSGKKEKYLEGAEQPPNRRYAVLDGRQRCAAIAMAFGGLRPENRRLRFSGRFYLNVAAKEDSKRIEFIKESEVERKQLDTDSTAIGKGLFPLSSSNEEESLMQQFYRYSQAITDASNYPDSKLPDTAELERRNDILARSFDGLMATKLAVYIVPATYSLADICEIFEVLNTTGTKVTTVDLIHSWLFSETSNEEQPILLRDWIDMLGDQDGALGWSSSLDRPEIIAQMTTAAYIALESKPEPRKVGRKQTHVRSVKSGDLLATPTEHWKQVMANQDEFATFLGDFQKCVADGAFGWRACPYPVTASIYVGLRWHHRFDDEDTDQWSRSDLDALFRAFFWRNALISRYDQGFLTQLGTDLGELKSILERRASFEDFGHWASYAEKRLDALIDKPLPDSISLRKICHDRQTGALQKALLLPVMAQARKDLLRPDVDISFPVRTDTQAHHIYPEAWCRNNRTGNLRKWLDPDEAEFDWVGSAANRMPLSRESNLEWRSENPGAILRRKGVTYSSLRRTFVSLFISEKALDHLLNGAEGLPHFWEARAETLASQFEDLMKVTT